MLLCPAWLVSPRPVLQHPSGASQFVISVIASIVFCDMSFSWNSPLLTRCDNRSVQGTTSLSPSSPAWPSACPLGSPQRSGIACARCRPASPHSTNAGPAGASSAPTPPAAQVRPGGSRAAGSPRTRARSGVADSFCWWGHTCSS